MRSSRVRMRSGRVRMRSSRAEDENKVAEWFKELSHQMDFDNVDDLIIYQRFEELQGKKV
jgi:hypothetical protein